MPTGMEGCPQSAVLGRTANNIMVTIVKYCQILSYIDNVANHTVVCDHQEDLQEDHLDY